MDSLKNTLYKVPLLRTFFRWIKNIVLLNRFKHHTLTRLNQFEARTDSLNQQMEQIRQELNQRMDQIHQELDQTHREQEEKLLLSLYRHGRSQQYRIDQFLFDVKERLAEPSITQIDAIAEASDTLDPFYLAFEDRFRGSREAILERCREYLPLLSPLRGRSTSTALDLGCGRGEWLQTLLSAGFQARGIDLGGAMIATCTQAGLDVQQLSALDALRAESDASLDLISAFHLIEHLTWNELYTLTVEIFRVLKPGGLVLLETPNAQNLLVATQTFYKDPTHRNPVHQDTLKFLLEYHGASKVSIHPLHPFPESMHLQIHSETEQRLNDWIYGAQDYLAIGVKGT
ncbi:MAG: class I SAM-dependent methyltransferase [Sulfuricurvum sp.]|jgi:O-antigen chain-terminating methyltransferase|uniref:class I SAM-dependent methyltransferase n=1 Tax=Sulfuricurvum sp. TaxID=2025608 RepID=UPI0025EB1F77|nr:class I SAM-dependent methyltransferase [Sulfuricurvum sp.]MCK9374487.1 class I SAM-dependent methyltransferase [Sulfuricurvum sp.]